MPELFDAVVVGGGQAGLAMSHALQERNVAHTLVERGRVGETWRTQRWHTFRLNTPGWANSLPGVSFPGAPDGFGAAEELISYFETYSRTLDLPVRTGVAVTGTTMTDEGDFRLHLSDGTELQARHVVAATGMLNRPRVPAIGAGLAPGIRQLHSAEYVSPDALPSGGVLVVGAAQSGCQIAEDLTEAGRTVYLAAGRAPRIPRRYRGRDIFAWLDVSGFFRQRVEDLPDPALQFVPQPQVSGVAGGRTTSYQQLARSGVRLYGRLIELDGTRASFAGDLHEHVRFADEMSARITGQIDEYIREHGIDAPPAEPDPAEAAEPSLLVERGPSMLDLAAAGVSTVIWSTGLSGDLSWLPSDAVDDHGLPRHLAGVGGVRGTYFVGFPWLTSRGSGIIAGVAANSEHVADVIAARLGTR